METCVGCRYTARAQALQTEVEVLKQALVEQVCVSLRASPSHRHSIRHPLDWSRSCCRHPPHVGVSTLTVGGVPIVSARAIAMHHRGMYCLWTSTSLFSRAQCSCIGGVTPPAPSFRIVRPRLGRVTGPCFPADGQSRSGPGPCPAAPAPGADRAGSGSTRPVRCTRGAATAGQGQGAGGWDGEGPGSHGGQAGARIAATLYAVQRSLLYSI